MVTVEEVSDDEQQSEQELRDEDTSTSNTEKPTSDDDSEGWTELMGKDLLLKIISSCSASSSTAVQPQDAVVVDFTGRLAASSSDTTGPIFHQASDWLVIIAEKDVVPALELAIRFMSIGDTATVWSDSKYAYGPSTRQYKSETSGQSYSLPANSNVMYQVTVKSVVPETERGLPEFAMRAALSKKTIANDVYAHEWDEGQAAKSRALYLYNRAILYCDQVIASNDNTPEQLQTQALHVFIDCMNNIAAVHLRAKEYHRAKAAAVRVLEKDANNFKALIRAAKASLLDPASSYEEVEEAIRAAEDVTDGSDNKDVQAIRADFKRRKQEYKRKTKAMMSKMSQALGENGTEDEKGEAVTTRSSDVVAVDTGDETIQEELDGKDASSKDKASIDDDLDAALEKLNQMKDSLLHEPPKNDDSPSWKSVFIQSALQVVLPIIIFYMFRWIQGVVTAVKDQEDASTEL